MKFAQNMTKSLTPKIKRTMVKNLNAHMSLLNEDNICVSIMDIVQHEEKKMNEITINRKDD